jgi:hypothetical protein
MLLLTAISTLLSLFTFIRNRVRDHLQQNNTESSGAPLP